MATVKDFEELRIWQDARVLSKEIYAITSNEAFSKDYRFCSQIRSAADSIMDNIAEGFERNGKKEFVQDEKNYEEFRTKCISESVSIANFISYLKKADINGLKYK